jgi:DNA topoisomerase II
MTEAGLKAATEKGLAQFFKLTTKMSTSNMMLFDADSIITKYTSPEHILKYFFALRLDHYEKRRVQLLARAQNQLHRISNKARLWLVQPLCSCTY